MNLRAQILVLFAAMFLGCWDIIFDDTASLTYLNAKFVRGTIGANLMPTAPPDPIDGSFDVRVENTNLLANLEDVSARSADVFIAQTRQKLGSIQLHTTWNGFLIPYDVDTVHFVKLRSTTTLFQPPCSQYVYLEIIFTNRSNEIRRIPTDSLLFTCVF